MKQRQFRKGYMLVEAILGVTLISMAQVYWLQNEHEQEKLEKASIFARSLSDVLHGIDKRVLLDGREEITTNPSTGAVSYGNWDATWTGNTAFVDQMVKRELVGRNNPHCGNPSNGWDAKLSTSDTEALVSCNKLNPNKIPFEFTIDAKRRSISSTDKHVLKDWYFLVYHDTRAKFEESAYLYPVIREKAKLYDVLEMSGRHDVSLVDRTDSNLREYSQASECLKAKERCAIMFRYRNSQAATASEDTALRRDGGNSMMGDLVFRTSAGSPIRCYNELGKDISCGFDFDTETGKLNTSARTMTANNFHLIYEDINSNIPVTTMCNKGSEVDVHSCGISLYGSGASVEAEAYFDRLYTNEVKISKLATDGSLKINDPNSSNYMEMSRQKLAYNGNAQIINFQDSLDFDSGNSAMNMSGKNIDITTKGDIQFKTDSLKINSPMVQINSVSDTSLINSKYTSGTLREVATTSDLLQGVVIVGIDKRVAAEDTVDKKKCPHDEGYNSVKAYAFPSNGFNTLIISDSNLYSRCDLSNGFVPNGGGYDSTCEVNDTNAKINYGVSSVSGNKWRADISITEQRTVSKGGFLNIIQYCQY